MAELSRVTELNSSLQALGLRFNSHALTEAVQYLGGIALVGIDDDCGLLDYHNVDHTLLVAKDAYEIGHRAHMGQLETAKAVIASLFHDRFQSEPGKWQNEQKSADYVLDLMRDTDIFYDKDYLDVYEAVLDTRCAPTSDSIGQNPQTHLGKVVADADVSYFLMPTAQAWDIGMRYFKELYPDASIDGAEFGDFAYRFSRILYKHRFNLPETASREDYEQMHKNAQYAEAVGNQIAA